MNTSIRKVLVTGATGYIGGRLVPRLLKRGYEVRCLARHPAHLQGRNWRGVDIVEGNCLHPSDVARAMRGIHAAFYLVHSMADRDPEFPHVDAQAAHYFARSATDAGVRRIIYLGGLGGPNEDLSTHLKSRQEVGDILRKEGPPVTEFRAAVIVGSGSLSFEMIRQIVERHPIMLSFSWLRTRCQPIAVRDVLNYLITSLEIEESVGRILEIGGSSIHTYEEMMRIYAQARGLKRFFIPVPGMYTRMCALWVQLTTPIPSGYALPLIESLKSEVVCNDTAALSMFPIVPLDYRTAVRYALLRIEGGAVETTWTMAIFPRHRAVYNLSVKEGVICEDRSIEVSATADRVFSTYSGIGGKRGWFFGDWLWGLRAAIDRLVGGVGMRRGRRHINDINQGEPLDFWRVERIVPNRLMLLRAEMKVPGKAWLQFESIENGENCSLLRQTAYFEPKGFFGNLYWYALYPVHRIIFSGLLQSIKNRAENPAWVLSERDSKERVAIIPF